MLEKVTWSQFWFIISIITMLYYIAIGIMFYRNRLLAFLQRAPRTQSESENHSAPGSLMGAINDEMPLMEEETKEDKDRDDAEVQPTTSENIQVLDRTEKVANLISIELSRIGTKAGKESILVNLSGIIEANNQDGRLMVFRDAIDWHIVQTAQDNCDISLDADDMNRIWHV